MAGARARLERRPLPVVAGVGRRPGIEEQLDPGKPSTGDAYDGESREIPTTLMAATLAMAQSEMLKQAFGEAVIRHYTRAAEWEQEAFNSAVTDWEIARGFERA